MKTICAPDNVACLVQNLPDTLGQIGLIFAVCVLAAAIFATAFHRSL